VNTPTPAEISARTQRHIDTQRKLREQALRSLGLPVY
jgi:hypothetical protein